jgi:hypothetical protein
LSLPNHAEDLEFAELMVKREITLDGVLYRPGQRLPLACSLRVLDPVRLAGLVRNGYLAQNDTRGDRA